MRALSMVVGIVVFAAAFRFAPRAWAQDGARQPPEPAFGFSLDHRWNQMLLRVLDRSGRPDERGSILQRAVGDTYAEYRLDLAVARHPLSRELAWATDPEGVRLWIQSVDEFTLATRATLQKHVHHGSGYVGFRYDGFHTRNWNTDLLRIDFAFEDVAVDGLSMHIRAYPRWEKDDSDVEFQIAYRVPDLVETRLRLVALDPFTNASAGLAKARGGTLVFDEQRDLPFMVLGEVSTVRLRGVRAEVYAGGVLPQTTRFRNDRVPDESHVRTESARLTGGMLEFEPLDEVAVGASGLVVDTSFDRSHPEAPDENVERREHHSELTGYLLVRPFPRLTLESFVRRTARPLRQDEMVVEDTEWMSSLRALWMLGDVGGVDVSIYRLTRDASGERGERVDGINHRFVTRCLLEFDPSIWVSFGVGWDLEPSGETIYDGAGMTMTARF